MSSGSTRYDFAKNTMSSSSSLLSLNSSSATSSNTQLQQNLLETTQKVEASLQQAIQEHIHSSLDFSPSHGLDFLDVKNSLLLSYIIELVYDFRNRLLQGNTNENRNSGGGRGGRDDASLHRLIVMRTVLDKMRGLDKKLRYQVRQGKEERQQQILARRCLF